VYIRFITQFINERGQNKTGLFQAMGFIRDHSLTDDEDESKLKGLTSWFEENLDAPKWFANPVGRRHETKSLSWFKDTAKEHILKVNELIEILEKYDLIIERVTSKDLGHKVYEDEFQVSAEPLKSHRKRVI
jgi:hypothetical protein